MSRPNISFEYFPPKSEAGRDKLLNETTPALAELGPEFFSCTYGAGGSTREHTLGVASSIKAMGLDVAPEFVLCVLQIRHVDGKPGAAVLEGDINDVHALARTCHDRMRALADN